MAKSKKSKSSKKSKDANLGIDPKTGKKTSIKMVKVADTSPGNRGGFKLVNESSVSADDILLEGPGAKEQAKERAKAHKEAANPKKKHKDETVGEKGGDPANN